MIASLHRTDGADVEQINTHGSFVSHSQSWRDTE